MIVTIEVTEKEFDALKALSEVSGNIRDIKDDQENEIINVLDKIYKETKREVDSL